MDLCLENGQHKKGVDGKPCAIEGIEELIQRALIRLSVRLSSFPHDMRLGSQFFRLKDSSTENLDHEAFAYACEALKQMKEVVVTGVSCRKAEGDTLNINVFIKISNLQHSLEVSI